MKPVILLAVTVLLGGCATNSRTTGTPIEVASVNKIVNGTTPLSDIIGLFGAPTTVSSAASEEFYIYRYCKDSGANLDLWILKTNTGGESCNELTVSFDKATSVVKSHNYRKAF